MKVIRGKGPARIVRAPGGYIIIIIIVSYVIKVADSMVHLYSFVCVYCMCALAHYSMINVGLQV